LPGRHSLQTRSLLDSPYHLSRPQHKREGASPGRGLAFTQAACARSIEKRDYGFTAQYCEADARALAKQNCEGRAYTAAMSSEFAPICQRFASRPAGRSYTAQPRQSGVPPAQAGTPAQAPNVTDTVKEGADLLKKFLKW
jgi:hypothetical protein